MLGKKMFTLGTYRWVLEYHYGTLAIFWYHDSLEAVYIEELRLYWHWSDNLNQVNVEMIQIKEDTTDSIQTQYDAVQIVNWELNNALIQSKTDVGTGLMHPCSWKDKEMSIVIPDLWYACLDLSGEISLLFPFFACNSGKSVQTCAELNVAAITLPIFLLSNHSLSLQNGLKGVQNGVPMGVLFPVMIFRGAC